MSKKIGKAPGATFGGTGHTLACLQAELIIAPKFDGVCDGGHSAGVMKKWRIACGVGISGARETGSVDRALI